jgi:hypothetical protein
MSESQNFEWNDLEVQSQLRENMTHTVCVCVKCVYGKVAHVYVTKAYGEMEL